MKKGGISAAPWNSNQFALTHRRNQFLVLAPPVTDAGTVEAVVHPFALPYPSNNAVVWACENPLAVKKRFHRSDLFG
jgi:hypothetical protein